MIKKLIVIDWLAMKFYHTRCLLLPIVGMIFGVIYSPLLVIPLLAYLGLSFSVNPFAVEEKGELNNLYLTLPTSRRQIVLGRYCLSLLILFVCIIIGFVLMVLTNTIAFFKCTIEIESLTTIIASSLLIYSIFNISTFPLLFKLGYQKGKMVGFYIPVILFSIIVVCCFGIVLLPGSESLVIDVINFISNNLILINGGYILLSMLIMYGSYTLSNKFYSQRDF